MLPWSTPLAGRLEEHEITSDLLVGNPLGDANVRPLWVYLPPGYDDDPARSYPSVYVIQGYTGHIAMWRNRSPYGNPSSRPLTPFSPGRRRRRRFSSTSTLGLATAAASSSTRPDRHVPLVPVATRSYLGSTRTSALWPRRPTGPSAASPAAASAP